MRTQWIFALFLLATFGLQACRLTPTEFSRSGGYIGGSLAYAFEEFDDLDPTASNESDDSAGFGVRAGYRLAPWIAGEIAYENFSDFDVKVADVEVQTLMLQGKIYPFTGRIQPYGLGGIGYARADIDFDTVTKDFDESDFSWRLGAGLDFYVLEFLPLFAEVAYTFPSGDIEELEYWTGSIGAYFRF